MRRYTAIVLVLALLASVAPLSRATQVIYQTPQQLGDRATLVVHGRVANVRSFWNDKQTKILTETTVDVDEAFKGASAGSIRIVQLGGTVGNVKVTVAGALQWTRGEEVVLFLERYDTSNYYVTGFSQGKFNVERDAQGQPFVKRPALEGIELVGAPAGSRAKASRVNDVSLDVFINQALGRK